MSSAKITPHGSMTSHALEGRHSLCWQPDDLKLRKFDNKNIPLSEIRKAIEGNNYDEVVFKTSEGDRYVVYADELKGKVKKGDLIEIEGIRGTIEWVDDEWNETALAVAGIAVAAGAGAAIGSLIGASYVLGSAGAAFAGASEVGAIGSLIGTDLGISAGAALGGGAAWLGGAFKKSDAGIKTMTTVVPPKSKK